MKILITTGQGIINLFDTAVFLKKHNIDVKVITGWVPGEHFPEAAIRFLGRIIGRKNLVEGLKRRRIEELSSDEIRTCARSEFFIQFLFLLSRYRLVSRDWAACTGWKAFGAQSKKYIADADVFHVRSGAGQGGAIMKARQAGMKILVDHSIAHPAEMLKQLTKARKGAPPAEYAGPGERFWNLVLQDCRMADRLMVNSNYVKESFVENGFDASKIDVVNMGINEAFFQVKNNWAAQDKVKVLFIGGFNLRKGAQLIIEAAEQLISRNFDFELNIVGDIGRDIDMPSWFSEYDGIHLHGSVPVKQLIPFLSENDLFIFPSYAEGCAQSLKIAMATGIPVITTRQSGGPVTHLQTGYIIPDDSASALADAIVEMSSNPGLRERIGAAACRLIKNEHTWDAYAQDTIKVYKRLLD